MILTNGEMRFYLETLEPMLERKDVLGYIAARNTRAFKDALLEFETYRDDTIREYGHHESDKDGNETESIVVSPDDENFDEFLAKMQELLDVEQDVNIVTTSYENAIGELTGQQILDLDWMFSD